MKQRPTRSGTTRKTVSLCAILTCGFSFCGLAQAPTESDPLAPARRALDRGIPEVAVTRIEQMLSRSLDAIERSEARLLLAEALVRSGNYDGALTLLNGATAPKGPAADFWKAQALASFGEWEAALAAYHSASESPEFNRQGEAVLGEAESLRRLQRLPEAIAVLMPLKGHPRLGADAKLALAELHLESGDYGNASLTLDGFIGLTDSQKARASYLRGQIALASGAGDKALELFRNVSVSPEGASEIMWAGAVIGEARALVLLSRVSDAGDVLEKFIRENPRAEALPSVFAELDRIYAQDTEPSRAELVNWTRDEDGPRHLLAEYYLARIDGRTGREKRAVEKLTTLRSLPGFPSAAIHRDVLSDLGSLLLATNHPGKAIETFLAAQAVDPTPAFQRWCDFMLGRCAYELQRYPEAITRFDAAAEDANLAADALYNSALSCVRAGDFDSFLERYAAFSARFPDSEFRRDLLIEQGRFQARNHDPQAIETLGTFARDFGDHPRAGEVLFCLAEYHFEQSPPNLEASRQELAHAREKGLEPEIENRAGLLEIWLAEAAGTAPEELVRKARVLASRSVSKDIETEVRLKLGEILFNIGDFVNSRREFELASSDQRRRSLALFLAARSAVRSMEDSAIEDAISIFEEVAQADDSPLASLARREQAEVHNLKGRHDEAVLLYDEILKREQDPTARVAALLGKARSLFAAGAYKSLRYNEAIATFDLVKADESATSSERDEAKYMRARCFERLGDGASALEAYYGTIEPRESQADDDSLFWRYKAGFDAARLLEAGKRWDSAIKIYEGLAALDGPRAEEAAERVKQLRLEHFLWEAE
jgi:tetratricopeptide (TPR) repeat protein